PGTSFPLRKVEAQRGNEPPVLVDANIEGDRVRVAAVDIGHFDAFDLRLRSGRAFDAGDLEAGNAVVINETLARNIGGNPLGVRLRYVQDAEADEPSDWYEVVGVVSDAGMDMPPPDLIYHPTTA